jgi:DNA-directed RNA polymerase beta subunit
MLMSIMSELIQQAQQKLAAPMAGETELRQRLQNRVRTAASAPPLPQTVREEDLVELHDYSRLRAMTRDRVLKAVTEGFPVSNATHELRVTDVKFAGPEVFSKADVKRAILEGRTLRTRLTGRWELRKKDTGELLASTGRKTLLGIPYLTDDGRYIRNGTAYSLQNQLRLRPGVYNLRSADGSPEAQFNAKQGSGGGFRTWLEPASSVFYLTVENKKVPLYPVLKEMGMDDDRLKTAWGEEIWKANAEHRVAASAVRWLNNLKNPATPEPPPAEDDGIEEPTIAPEAVLDQTEAEDAN